MVATERAVLYLFVCVCGGGRGMKSISRHVFTSDLGIFFAELGSFPSEKPLGIHRNEREEKKTQEKQVYATMKRVHECCVNKPLCSQMPTKLKHFTQLAKNTPFSFFFFLFFSLSLSLSLSRCCLTTSPPLSSLKPEVKGGRGHPGT